MVLKMAQDTIAAIATPVAQGGIGIVRISGSEAMAVGDAVFKTNRGVSLTKIQAYSAALGHAYCGEQMIDQCIALVFRAPRSYTGEDVVELQCHGGVYIMRRILEAALLAGARLAGAGEFTARAYLNGRIDLTSAEAVMDMISAKGEQAAAAAIAQHEGALFRRISKIKAALYDISADICAFVDFPEEDIPELGAPVLQRRLAEIDGELIRCIETYDKGRIQREGIKAVIAGKPNVGKSTLMNLIAGYEKSIVTPIPGTTRDIVEESVYFAGCPLILADTAGLRDTIDLIESIGVGRARSRLDMAELVFAVFDASCPLDDEDKALLELIKNKRAVAVINKSDLPNKIDKLYIRDRNKQIVEIAAISGEGIEELEKVTAGLLAASDLDTGNGIIANERQLECVRAASEGIRAALAALEDGITLDAVSTGIEQAVAELAMLTGERASQEIIERVFEKFCVGK
jgi:tRNA modification GTPase